MEYVSKINIFGLKMMVTSGLEILKSLSAQSLFKTILSPWGKWGSFKKMFYGIYCVDPYVAIFFPVECPTFSVVRVTIALLP